MDPRRWEQTKQTFQETIACLPGDRAAFLARVCDGDEELRREATRLLEAHEKAGDFIESPAFATTPEFLLADPDALIGDRLGHYQIESVLGLGGMGVVYLARDEKLGRQVGLKLLPPSLVADEAQLERLQREARTASALNHPNIVTIHEIGEVNGTHYIATEYIEGITLRERLAQGSIPPNESLEIARQFVSALSVAHEAGIVHRDIKPENIMLRRDGLVKVLDFGIAKLAPSSAAESLLKTREGAVLGTVAYMSPEQARGLEVDARTDIWSAGVVLYEMLTGHQPFSGATPTDVIIALAERSPPTIRETQYGKMLGRALAKKREERYQSAKDLLADLRNHRDTPRGSPPSRKRRRLTVALLVALIIASFVSWFFLRRASPDRTQHAIKSLAVLPLANLSGDAAQDYFADGMTEALITDLAKVDALRVISRASVMQYKGTRKPLREIGDELKVDGVLTGSVARSGERMRVAVQLTQAATDENIWAQSYERDLRDALTLQREVARNIVSEIRIKLSPQDEVRFGRVGSVNPEAYDQYLRGQFYLHRQDRAENEAAIAALERAVALDSTFAAAHASLAQAYVWKLFLFAPEEQQLAEKAFVATEKALALDPNLAEAYLARGRLLWTPANRFPHEKAIREYRRALALNPGLDEARNQLALVYNHIGAFDEAFEELHRAVATNPSNTLAQFRIGQTLLFQGKYEEALSALRGEPREVNPSLIGYQIALALFHLGRKDDAAVTLDQFLKDYPEDNGGLFTSVQAILAASAGEEQTAAEKIAAAVERGKGFGHFHHTAYHIACAYAFLRKPEPALKWLETAADDGFPCYPLFARDPNLQNLRGDERFVAFLEKMRQQRENYRTILNGE